MRHSLILATIAACLLLAGAVVFTIFSLRHNITPDAAAMIRPGMTRAQVESILGGPPGPYYRWRQTSPILLPDSFATPYTESWISDDYAVVVGFDAGNLVVIVRQPVGMHHGGRGLFLNGENVIPDFVRGWLGWDEPIQAIEELTTW